MPLYSGLSQDFITTRNQIAGKLETAFRVNEHHPACALKRRAVGELQIGQDGDLLGRPGKLGFGMDPVGIARTVVDEFKVEGGKRQVGLGDHPLGVGGHDGVG